MYFFKVVKSFRFDDLKKIKANKMLRLSATLEASASLSPH